MRIQLLKLLGLSLALAFLAWAAGYSGLLGLAQAGKPITVCASGCDFSKIQAAIDAAPNGSTIQVQTGSYKENLTIRNKDGLTLQGAGRDLVTLDGNAPQQQNITPGVLILNSRNITVTGFKITNSRRGLEADDTTLLFIEANTFEKNLRQGILLTRSEAQLKSNTIQANQVDIDGSNGSGLFLFQGSQATLTDTVIKENANCGLEEQFDSTKPANQVTDTSSGNTITGNRGGDLCGNLPTTVLAQPLPEGTLDQVSVPTDAPTLQEAIDKVKAGGTITLAAGTFKQPVEAGVVQIYKSVKIMGAGQEQTVLQAPSSEWVVLNIATDGLDVTLQGLRVTGGQRGVQINTGPASTVSVSDVKVDGNGRIPSDGGIRIFGQASVTVQKSTITDNASVGISAIHNARATIDGNTIARNAEEGIFVGGTAQAQITNNQVNENKKGAQDCCGSGIVGRGSSQVTIQGNTLSKNAESGIWMGDTAQLTIKQNTISDNSNAGIYVRNNSTATIDGNTITGNVGWGIYAGETVHAQITNNQIMATKPVPNANFGYGISVYQTAQVTLQGNTISQNSSYGIVLRDSSQLTIQKNTISNNRDRGVVLFESSKATLDDNTVSNNVTAGIDLFESSQATIINNRVTGTKKDANGNNGLGIAVEGNSKATIQNSTIQQNALHGVFLRDNAQATVQKNTISDNKEIGIIMGVGSSHATIDDNTIAHNLLNGIAVSNSSEATITNNRITGSAAYGIQVYMQSKSTIRNNTITDSGDQGIRVGATSIQNELLTTEISDNTVQGNKGCGIFTDNDSGIKITGQDNTISGNSKGQLCGTTSKFPDGFGGGK